MFLNSRTERLYTKNLVLERMGKNDFNFFKKIIGDPLVLKYFSEYRKVEKKKETKKYFQKEILDKQSAYCLFLVIRKDETPIGFLNIYYIVNGVWMVECALLEEYRRKGYMKEVMDFLVEDSKIFLMSFKSNSLTMRELNLAITNENSESEFLIKKIIKDHNLAYAKSSAPFYKSFKKKNGESWYKIMLE